MNLKKEFLRSNLIYVVHDFLPKDRCELLIEMAKFAGFDLVEGSLSRNNSRVVTTEPKLSAELWEMAKPFVDDWCADSPVGLNERLRFYRYGPGQEFKPHFDGGYQRLNGDRSEFTFLIYLNDDFVGGETKFFDPDLLVKPKTGNLLVFYHHQAHSGEPVLSGVKYVLRSDVMYRN